MDLLSVNISVSGTKCRQNPLNSNSRSSTCSPLEKNHTMNSKRPHSSSVGHCDQPSHNLSLTPLGQKKTETTTCRRRGTSVVNSYHSDITQVQSLNHPGTPEGSLSGSLQNSVVHLSTSDQNMSGSPMNIRKRKSLCPYHADLQSSQTPKKRVLPNGKFKQDCDSVSPKYVLRTREIFRRNSESPLTAHAASPSSHHRKGQKKVDLREVVARMESEVVKEVLKMDVPRDLVERAISKRLSENGQDFSSSENLLDAVFSLDHNETITRSIEPLKDAPGKAESEQGVQDAKAKDDSVRLMEENRQLKEQRQCKICMDEEVCMAFLPCGHLVCCSTCAPALSSCPICRAKVRGTVRTYLS